MRNKYTWWNGEFSLVPEELLVFSMAERWEWVMIVPTKKKGKKGFCYSTRIVAQDDDGVRPWWGEWNNRIYTNAILHIFRTLEQYELNVSRHGSRAKRFKVWNDGRIIYQWLLLFPVLVLVAGVMDTVMSYIAKYCFAAFNHLTPPKKPPRVLARPFW